MIITTCRIVALPETEGGSKQVERDPELPQAAASRRAAADGICRFHGRIQMGDFTMRSDTEVHQVCPHAVLLNHHEKWRVPAPNLRERNPIL